MANYTYRDGKMVEVPDIIATEDTELHEPVKNTLIIRPGVAVVSYAKISGTIVVMPGATLDARGPVSGTVTIQDEARATFHSSASGTVKVSGGAVMHLLPGSIALGVLKVEGTLINEGTRGLNVTGQGVVDDRIGSIVRRPDRTLRDGTTVYERYK
ncbi:hypothetical protein [Arthrobacter rhombi]|uniref:hypothetical protein n=1 Tax=Arthrobacter rhombi TaxID=71253 RepID=UPI003FD61B44